MYTPTFTEFGKPTLVNTITKTPTPKASPIATQYHQSPSTTPTQQTPTVTLTPPGLTELQIWNNFFRLMKDNAGCKLPCWWGITPGITSWEEARQMVNQIGLGLSDWTLPNGIVHHGTGIQKDSHLIQNLIGFYEIDGVVQSIDIEATAYEDKNYFHDLWKNYSPDQLMAIYGTPSEIFLTAGISHAEISLPGSGLILKYQDEFMAFYTTRPVIVDVQGKPTFRICPSWQDITWDPNIQMWLKSSLTEISLKEIAQEISNFDISSFKSIEDAAGISVNEFYNRFSPGNEPACFDTPQDLWK